MKMGRRCFVGWVWIYKFVLDAAAWYVVYIVHVACSFFSVPPPPPPPPLSLSLCVCVWKFVRLSPLDTKRGRGWSTMNVIVPIKPRGVKSAPLSFSLSLFSPAVGAAPVRGGGGGGWRERAITVLQLSLCHLDHPSRLPVMEICLFVCGSLFTCVVLLFFNIQALSEMKRPLGMFLNGKFHRFSLMSIIYSSTIIACRQQVRILQYP